MINVKRNATNHNFEKQNLVTQFDKYGQYDVFKCSLCGLTGKAYRLDEIRIDGRHSVKSAYSCPKAKRVGKIRITVCRAVGKQFANLTPGSEHDVVDAPKGLPNSLAGVWVMGIGEPVKVLVGEYEEVKETE